MKYQSLESSDKALGVPSLYWENPQGSDLNPGLHKVGVLSCPAATPKHTLV